MVTERRRDERIYYERPELISVEIEIDAPSNKKRYSLNVLDSSKYGLGVIVPPDKADILRYLKTGTKIKKMRFFAKNSMIDVKGTVVHVTKIKKGRFDGSYLVGIESQDIIEAGG